MRENGSFIQHGNNHDFTVVRAKITHASTTRLTLISASARKTSIVSKTFRNNEKSLKLSADAHKLKSFQNLPKKEALIQNILGIRP